MQDASQDFRAPVVPAVTNGQRRFAKFAWVVLGIAVFAVLWGAFVRSSVSGDGCGTHWPLCGNSLLPDVKGLKDVSITDLIGKLVRPDAYATEIGKERAGQLALIVELSHRIQSVGMTVLTLVLLVWGWISFPKTHPVRTATVLAVFNIILEILVGAVLVKRGLVTHENSSLRASMMPFHLVNTFVLMAGLALTAWYASGKPKANLRSQGPIAFVVLFMLGMTVWLAITGALSALGGMVYHDQSHAEVLRAAMAKGAPYLMRAKPQHPYTAVVVSMVLCLAAGLLMRFRPSADTHRFANWVWFLLTAQMVAGLVNIMMMAPPWMQLVHLGLANLLWMVLVLLSAAALAEGVPQVEMSHVPDAVLNGARAGVMDYVALTKPRVISLLLFTTLMAMFIAARGWPGDGFLPGLWLLVATGTGLYAAAGSSNAINMVCERDLDVLMERTASRPTVTEKIHPRTALWFAFALESFSFALLWWSSNLLAATLALAGLVVYVIVYTLLLKRRTWSNIVIGGAAGAFPPLVGWAAATNNLGPLAWLLFALIFVWTPVHFWALALLIQDDYRKAGVPMLPVVKGERYTVIQMAMYGVVTMACSFAPFLFGQFGWIYGTAALVLNIWLLRGCARLFQGVDRARASSLFHFSMLYLALLFLAMAVDQSVIAHHAWRG